MSWHRVVAPALLAGLVACGSTASEVHPDGEAELTGRFTGRFTSQDQGVLLDGFLTLELTESSEGVLDGGFSLEGVLDDGEFQQPILPRPDHRVHRVLDRRVAGLLVTGPIIILDAACEVLLTFPSTISMRR